VPVWVPWVVDAHQSGIDGPWTELPAASPFRLSSIGEQGFFRVKVEE
jgi:hypothetical protein